MQLRTMEIANPDGPRMFNIAPQKRIPHTDPMEPINWKVAFAATNFSLG